MPSFQDSMFEPAEAPTIPVSRSRDSRPHQSRRRPRSSFSEGTWKADTPFGPPYMPPRHGIGMRRIRKTLWKLSPQARVERSILRQKSRNKSPLTTRNVETFVSKQKIMEAVHPTDNGPEVQVTAWLEQLS